MASILTGLYPRRHGTNGERDSLSEEVEYLPELLSRSGYDTAAVTTNGVVSGRFGFDRGFDHFVYLAERPGTDPRIHRGADVLHDAAWEWLETRSSEQPFFLYLHATDPHAPYRPPEPWHRRFAEGVDVALGDHGRVEELGWNPTLGTSRMAEDLSALYDGEIAFVDDQFGRLMSRFQEADLYDDLLVILISDHGEEFGDHGRWQHGMTLNEEQLRVPLIVKLPHGRSRGTRIGHVVEQIDVAPTVLNLVGLGRRPEMQGFDLLQPADRAHDSVAFALLARQPRYRHVESIVEGDRKLIHYEIYDRPRRRSELFDLVADPDERRDLSAQFPIEAGFLRMRLRWNQMLWRPAEVAPAEIDEELRQSLRAVGYLD